MKKYMTVSISLFCFVVAILAFSRGAFAETVDSIIAKVGSEVITQNDFNVALETEKLSLTRKFGEKEGLIRYSAFRKNALQEMVLSQILDAEIKREKISVTDDAIQREYQTAITQSSLSEPKFLSFIAQKGLSAVDYKLSLKRDLEERQFIDKKIMPAVIVSDEELQREYQRNIVQYQAYSKLRFIEVFLAKEKFSSEAELMATAKTLRQALVSGRNVTDQIKNSSSGAYADKGGDSGVVDADSLNSDVRTLVLRLKNGETSPFYPANQGVYLFKLISKMDPKPLPFNVVSGRIRAQLSEKRVQNELKKYLFAIKDQTYVEILR